MESLEEAPFYTLRIFCIKFEVFFLNSRQFFATVILDFSKKKNRKKQACSLEIQISRLNLPIISPTPGERTLYYLNFRFKMS
jgi:hypothetical protein